MKRRNKEEKRKNKVEFAGEERGKDVKLRGGRVAFVALKEEKKGAAMRDV